MSSTDSVFDYIVVGAGSAGCVLASRLSEDGNARVLLLEGGGSNDRPEVHDPRIWPELFYGELDWGWSTQPLRSCNNRVDHLPRAKMLGGCHSHNASAWVRGQPADFDRWAAGGCEGWGWSDVLPLFRRIEDWQGPASELRGSGGPVYVTPPETTSPLATAFVEGAVACGVHERDWVNEGDLTGVGYFNFTVKDGRRYTVVDGYLAPALSRPNLTVATHAEADRLLLDGSRCTGIQYRHGGEVHSARASAEVILCAGTIGSPRILQLSGIGPQAMLRSAGIDVVADMPGVGANLQDHPLLAGLVYECQGELPERVNNSAESTLWWKSDSRLPGPDIQPVFIAFPLASPELEAQLPHEHCYTISPSVVRPQSRGSVTLASADPAADPLIDVNFLAEESDMRAMLAAVELCREIGNSDAFKPFRAREVMPGPLDRAAMQEFIRNSASTYFHPVGTCAMGRDSASVVDPQLRVHGIEGLRVADASIMPDVTSGNTNAPSVMIGEKASDLIRD